MVEKSKQVVDHQVIDHGIEHSQYFQGCGISHTDYDDVQTGVGYNPHEAMEDALESLACQGWDVEDIENDLPSEPCVSDTCYCPACGNEAMSSDDIEDESDYEGSGDWACKSCELLFDNDDDERNYYVSVRVRGERREDDDYTTDDFVHFNRRGKLIKVPDGERWQDVIRADMEAQHYWPNVWRISDHGNEELVQW